MSSDWHMMQWRFSVDPSRIHKRWAHHLLREERELPEPEGEAVETTTTSNPSPLRLSAAPAPRNLNTLTGAPVTALVVR